jgi:N-acetyl-gamma-glutamyl-phosphate reductase
MTANLFIDGEAGTTGLEIRQRLAGREDLRIATLDADRRKDPAARRGMLNDADIVILCLPDEAAREAVGLIDSPHVRVIDASSAHRTAANWTYGFPEMARGQAERIAASQRVSNPGCYPTGFIALVRPLVEAGLIPADWPVSVNAVSGYSGGGRAMIAEFEEGEGPAFRLYGLDLAHKHAPEMRVHAGLSRTPLFAPAVGRYRQGMIVEVPLQLDALPGAPRAREVQAILASAYPGPGFVEVATAEEAAATRILDPQGLNHSNRMRLFAFPSPDGGQVRLAAVLDNLGKGASGAAVQNLDLMLGAPPALGL